MVKKVEAKMSQEIPAKSGALKRWAPIAILAAIIVFAFAMGWHEQFTLSNLIKNRAQMHAFVAENFWLSSLAFVGIYIVATALLFPAASLLTIAGGLVFGALFTTVYTGIGATIGATILFLVVRSSFGKVLSQRAGPFLAKLADGFKENAFSYLLFLRLVPAFPFWLINVAPAFFNVPVSTYFFATLIGILPGTFAYALLGEGLDSLILAQEMANPGCADAGTCEINLAAAITPEIIAAIVGLIVVSILPIAIKKWRAKL